MSQRFVVLAERASDLSEQECRRRLAAAYRLILSYQPKDIADRESLASTTRTATSGAPAAEPKAQ
jgi:hypothetical protein